MNRWTFGHKIAAGFVVMLALTMIIGTVSMLTLRSVVAQKDRLVTVYAANMLAAEKLSMIVAEQVALSRGYYLSEQPRYLESARDARAQFDRTWSTVNQSATTERERHLLDQIDATERAYWTVANQAFQLRRVSNDLRPVIALFEAQIAPKVDTMTSDLDSLLQTERAMLDNARQSSTDAANRAVWAMLAIAGLAIALATSIAVVLSRSLTQQIGATVQKLHGSSSELQAAANQQATGSGEQAAAMAEVSTTMRELLSTSRQITESAQRVARIADETASAARVGGQSVHSAQEIMRLIKRHVDQIVTHMLDLGRKSQQIGLILELIKELAEQTNILAINATIEAAGAGEHGRRFAAVADEIRKLADRVGGSTGEIRSLVEEIRGSANTTVMATEEGSKAVDSGTRQFAELATAFLQISDLVGTTAEAAREIELSTKQQSTAVEQVNTAIADAAQAAKETEASSRQTLQTSVYLAGASHELALLIRPSERT